MIPLIAISMIPGFKIKEKAIDKLLQRAYELCYDGNTYEAVSLLKNIKDRFNFDDNEITKTRILIKPFGTFNPVTDIGPLLEYLLEIYSASGMWREADETCNDLIDKLNFMNKKEISWCEGVFIKKAECLKHLHNTEAAIEFLSNYSFIGPDKNSIDTYTAKLKDQFN